MKDSPLHEAVLSYVVTVDELYGHYLDTTAGFNLNARQVKQSQSEPIGGLDEDADRNGLPFFYGHGDPNDPANIMLHQTTQGQYVQRNIVGGHNHVRAGQWLVVLLFEYWESEHRRKIATALGLAGPTDLKVPYMGELRLLRQDVIHHRGKLQKATIQKVRFVGSCVVGDDLDLNDALVESIVRGLKSAMDDVVTEAGHPDPEHRKIWHIQ